MRTIAEEATMYGVGNIPYEDSDTLGLLQGFRVYYQ